MTKKSNYRNDMKRLVCTTTPPSITTIEKYITELPLINTVNLRNRKIAKELILNAITENTFILIDGPSMSGKSTFAPKLAKEISGIVIDIDYLAAEYYLKHSINKKEAIENFSFKRINEETDSFIINNLQKIIKEKKKEKKPIILVGTYIQILQRAIVMKTIGKMFKKTVSIFCCEESEEAYKKLYLSRKHDLNNLPCNNEFEKECKNFRFASSLIQSNLLGFGFTNSYVINTTVSDEFQ